MRATSRFTTRARRIRWRGESALIAPIACAAAGEPGAMFRVRGIEVSVADGTARDDLRPAVIEEEVLLQLRVESTTSSRRRPALLSGSMSAARREWGASDRRFYLATLSSSAGSDGRAHPLVVAFVGAARRSPRFAPRLADVTAPAAATSACAARGRPRALTAAALRRRHRVPGVLHVHFVRKPHARADRGLDTERPGAPVLWRRVGGDIKHSASPRNAFFPDMKVARFHSGDGAVRFVGEPIVASWREPPGGA